MLQLLGRREQRRYPCWSSASNAVRVWPTAPPRQYSGGAAEGRSGPRGTPVGSRSLTGHAAASLIAQRRWGHATLDATTRDCACGCRVRGMSMALANACDAMRHSKTTQRRGNRRPRSRRARLGGLGRLAKFKKRSKIDLA
eukprot:scaffold60852_cov63-Phaeocystis_antarctica.AAC.6